MKINTFYKRTKLKIMKLSKNVLTIGHHYICKKKIVALIFKIFSENSSVFDRQNNNYILIAVRITIKAHFVPATSHLRSSK